MKVERPGAGDNTRQWGPPFTGGESAYFLTINRNKRRIASDLTTEAGQDLVRRTAAEVDVVLENFRPGTMDDWGLEYDILSADHPGLVAGIVAQGMGAEHPSIVPSTGPSTARSWSVDRRRVNDPADSGLTPWASGRTLAGHEEAMPAETTRTRSERLEVRTTPEDRALINRAVAASGTDLTDFVITNLTTASQRVLANRVAFSLGSEAQEAWESTNRRPARSLAGLRELMARPSPFVDE